VFLQGLLLLSPEALPGSMVFARPVLAALSRIAAGIGKPVPEIALGYVRDRFPEARVIFGAETASQVRENLAWWNAPQEIDLAPRIEEAFAAVDETLINPAMWPERRAM
jgi:aryl-alcohol dehydrogenase-like predicted oxidoreductase